MNRIFLAFLQVCLTALFDSFDAKLHDAEDAFWSWANNKATLPEKVKRDDDLA